MSLYLRILLIVMSLLAAVYAVRQIRKSQMKIENAIYWFMFILIILDKYERHIVTLSCGLATVLFVFGFSLINSECCTK